VVLSVFLAVCCLVVDFLGSPALIFFAPGSPLLYGGVFLVDYMISCFDLFFDILKQDNLLIVLPFCSLVFCFCFVLVIRLIKGEYYG
jgi:hypothetical protein